MIVCDCCGEMVPMLYIVIGEHDEETNTDEFVKLCKECNRLYGKNWFEDNSK